MALHPHEDATIRAFVAPHRKDRLLQQLGSPTGRKGALNKLNHFAGWDIRYARSIPSSTNILPLLKAAGAPAACHLISDDPELDGRDLPLADAIARAEDFDFASILCCDPGRLAFFFDEARVDRLRLLLSRPATT